MKSPVFIFKLVAVVACIAMLLSGFTMAQRIAAFHKENPREIFAFQRVDFEDFNFAGRHVKLAGEEQDGIEYVRVTYGDHDERLLVTLPGEKGLPLLLRNEQWLRVLLFASAMNKSLDQLHTELREHKVEPRMVIVTRTPRPGEPLAYAGRLNPRAWTFDFYELLPQGGFKHEKLAFPTSKVYEKAKEGELRENTWQYQAALSVIPSGISPKPKFTDDGLKAAGWTLPATSLSTLVMLGAIGLAASKSGRFARPAAA
ncbi:MAG TPA: hypothetical protein VK176_02915 [Phycisphaerales bacterium]|nr:hypothetical protein [Phycisphaerales bacterium]